jgi:hypothetical protein
MKMYKAIMLLLGTLAIVVLTIIFFPFVICGGMTLTNPSTFSNLPDDEALEQLLDLLATEGATVEYVRELQPSETLTPVKTHLVHINNQPVNLHEYSSSSTMQQSAERVSPDGRTIRLPLMYGLLVRREVIRLEHPTSLYYFQSDRFIVVYFGNDSAVTATLKATLGDPFAWDELEP